MEQVHTLFSFLPVKRSETSAFSSLSFLLNPRLLPREHLALHNHEPGILRLSPLSYGV